MKQLNLHKQPRKFLEKIQQADKSACFKIVNKIEELLINPIPASHKKLSGHKDLHRIRIDKYRIIYCFDEKILTILCIAKRDDVYEMLINLRR
jgi:mRNA interferase RelE/StbE